jgi:hypothetical protein
MEAATAIDRIEQDATRVRTALEGQWTAHVPACVLACARGCYQRDLLEGRETWSGSSLRGKATKWRLHYKWSRDNLIARVVVACADNGIAWRWIGGNAHTGPRRLEYKAVV